MKRKRNKIMLALLAASLIAPVGYVAAVAAKPSFKSHQQLRPNMSRAKVSPQRAPAIGMRSPAIGMRSPAMGMRSSRGGRCGSCRCIL